jgi:hypothetical protein
LTAADAERCDGAAALPRLLLRLRCAMLPPAAAARIW